MSRMSVNEFFNQARACVSDYNADNSWFYQQGNPFTGIAGEFDHISAAFRIYELASAPSLGVLLLGDTKIRKDPTLVQNFGLASGSGIQDQKEVEMGRLINAERRKMFGPNYIAVTDSGSILSDKKWSPLLNDALMLGGAHSRIEFVFAEDRANLVPQAHRSAKDWWLTVFNTYPDILWGSWGAPRVFARELIGLKLSGYRPVFSYHQLGFDPGAAQVKSFRDYLGALKAANFESANKAAIIRTISEWLFGNRDAIAV